LAGAYIEKELQKRNKYAAQLEGRIHILENKLRAMAN